MLFKVDTHLYGVDWSGPLPNESDLAAVEVPPITLSLTSQSYSDLTAIVSPLGPSYNHGLNLYLAACTYVETV